MQRFVNNSISVFYSFFRFSLLKMFHWRRFSFYPIERFSPNTQVFFMGKGRITLGKKIRAHSNVRLRATRGYLKVDDNAGFNYGCIVCCKEHIHIGKGVQFGPNVMVYDHDHDFRAKGGLRERKFKYGNVEIGENCWIGANTVILRNTKLGKNCVVAAGSVLINCEYPDNSMIYQKRETQHKIFEIETN